MNILNIELYSILIITILMIDYFAKYRKVFSNNSYLWYYLCSSVLLVSILNILTIMTTVDLESNRIFSLFSYLFLVIPSIILSRYVTINYLYSRKNKEKANLLVIFFYLLIYVILSFTIFFTFSKISLVFYALNKKMCEILLVIFSTLPLVHVLIKLFVEKATKKGEVLVDYKVYLSLISAIIGVLLDIIISNLICSSLFYTVSIMLLYLSRNDKTIFNDSLTKVYNRRYLDHKGASAKGKNKILAVYMLDMDHFKEINDTYGHNAGDEALITAAEIFRSSIRAADTIIRYGGDEFVILAKIKEKTDLPIIPRKIQANLALHNENAKIKLSVSIGSGIYENSEMELNKLFLKIDKKMYKEKELKKKKEKQA